jgi:hypothetical protein
VYQENKENDISMDSLYILEITLSNFGDYDLQAYYPVPLKNHFDVNENQDINPLFIEGPSRVRYSSSGETSFNKNPYQITVRDGNDVLTHGYNEEANKLDGYWKLLLTDSNDSNF